jgi:hypothetical protein
MANVLTSPEDVCNAALAQIGYKSRIGSMYDGSEQSKVALDIYGQTRDYLLVTHDWDFARASVTGTLMPGPAPAPWQFMYAYPANCIRVRDIISPAYLANLNDPLPINFTRDTTAVGTSMVEVILCNVSGAIIVFTEQVTSPALWQEGFTEAMIAALAVRLSAALASLDVAKLAAAAQAAIVVETADIIG